MAEGEKTPGQEKQECPPKNSRLRLYMAVFVVDLLYISTGCVLTWPSANLSHLDGLTSSEGSWVGSLMAVGAAIGPVVNSVTSQLLGRRGNLFLNAAVFVISFLGLAFTRDVGVIMAFRFLGGVAVGLSFNTIPVYLTEIADDKVRQAATSLAEFFIGFGYLIEYGLGPILSYEILQLIPIMTVLLFVVPFYWMPETPYFLMSKGKRKEAASALSWLRMKEIEDIQPELQTIEACMKEKLSQENISLKEQFSKIGHRRAFLISLLCLFVQQLSGVNVIISFTQQIFDTIELPVTSSHGALIVGLMNEFSSAFAPPLVKRYGTKMVLIGCSVIIGVSHCLFAVYTYLTSHNVHVPYFSLLPVILLAIFNIFFCIGVGPLPWSVIAELSPPDFRSFTTASISTFSWVISFILLRSFEPVKKAIGIWAVFTFFGVTFLVGTLFIYFVLPDTKGMSLLRIQELLKGEAETPKREENVFESTYI